MNWRQLTVQHWCIPPRQAGRPPSRSGCRSGCRETAGPGSLRWWWAGCLPGAALSPGTTAAENEVLLASSHYINRAPVLHVHAHTALHSQHNFKSPLKLKLNEQLLFFFSVPHLWSAPRRMLVWCKRTDDECALKSARCVARGYDVPAELGGDEEEKRECKNTTKSSSVLRHTLN